MKYEDAWDYLNCPIGHPCSYCDNKCTFRLDKDADADVDEKDKIHYKPKST